MALEDIIKQVFELLTKTRFTLHNEKKLQSEIRNLLLVTFSNGKAEYILDRENIIDFFISGVGIEVKVKGSKREIYKQCVRYCEFDEVKALILVTNVPTGFPEEINGKDCYVLKLSNAWL